MNGLTFSTGGRESELVNNFKRKLEMDDPQPGLSTCQNLKSKDGIDDFVEENSRRKRRKLLMQDGDNNKNSFKDNVDTDGEDEETFKEVCDESVSSGESDDDDSDEFNEIDGSDAEWCYDGCFNKFEFEGTAGLKCLPDGLHAYDFFKLLFDKNFFSSIVTEANMYWYRKKGDQWKEFTVEEFKVFVGLILHMDTIKCPQLHNYWSNHRLFNFHCFSQHMSRKRFQEILHGLHFCSMNTNNCQDKTPPIIDYFNNKMKEIYLPHRELSVNKVIVPRRGLPAVQQYITGRTQEHCAKLCILSESSGIALRVKVHEGCSKEMSPQEYATKIALQLLEDFLQKGHSVYTDKHYSSYRLTKQLLDARTYCTGVLPRFYKGTNLNFFNTNLAKGEMLSRYRSNIMIGRFRSKRDIFFISSEFNADLTKLASKESEKHKMPVVLHKYNECMNSIDEKDEQLHYYTSLRSFKWCIRIWVYVVEALLFNSYFLYLKYSFFPNKQHFYDFRLDIINNLLFENNQQIPAPTISHNGHLPEILPRDENNRVKRKRCRHCFSKGIRKNINYFCGGCKDNPGLCLGKCFKEYHKHLV